MIRGKKKANDSQETHWEKSSDWYDSLVGKEGHYYHKNVIIPKLVPLLALNSSSSILDLGCGQGILARALPPEMRYLGIDLSSSLISSAKKTRQKNQDFLVADICKPLPLKGEVFTHAAIMLVLQNVENPDLLLKNVNEHLPPGGKLVIVLNHPCFRIPRQSHWGVDADRKIQQRRIDRYMSPLKIPIKTHPGAQKTPLTYSFHLPLSDYSRLLANAGFIITLIEEWVSNKESTGKASAMENRARQEFPLFLAIKAEKR